MLHIIPEYNTFISTKFLFLAVFHNVVLRW